MGIDARILIKITKPESWLDATALRKFSSCLTSIVGPEHFTLMPEENRHAITFVADDFRRWADDPNTPHCYGQDGPDIYPQPNEQFLEIHVVSRYYGEDYARGDWRTLSFVIMWAQYSIPNCEVWYGGDSSGVCVELATSELLNRLTKFFLTSGHETYWMNSPAQNLCEFCRRGVIESGGGQGSKFYLCAGCGSEWLVKDQKLVTKYDRRKDERCSIVSFWLADQVRSGKRALYPFDGVFRQTYNDTPAIEAPAPLGVSNAR